MTDVGLRISTKKYKKTIETFPFQIESSALECTMKFLLLPTHSEVDCMSRGAAEFTRCP